MKIFIDAKNEYNAIFDKWIEELKGERGLDLIVNSFMPCLAKFLSNDVFSKLNSFKYSAKEINKIIDSLPEMKPCMQGTQKEIERLKPIIEIFYSQFFFYLSYWKSECGWHGWNWSEDNGTMKAQAELTDGLTYKMKEIYAMILKGLGQRMEENV